MTDFSDKKSNPPPARSAAPSCDDFDKRLTALNQLQITKLKEISTLHRDDIRAAKRDGAGNFLYEARIQEAVNTLALPLREAMTISEQSERTAIEAARDGHCKAAHANISQAAIALGEAPPPMPVAKNDTTPPSQQGRRRP